MFMLRGELGFARLESDIPPNGWIISRGLEVGVKALRPRTRRAKRGLDAGPASAMLWQPGNVIREGRITYQDRSLEPSHSH